MTLALPIRLNSGSKPAALFAAQLEAFGYPYESEVPIIPGRRHKADFVIPDRKIAFEIEGGSWVDGAHVRGVHFEEDCVKYATAARLGWTVIRVTSDMVRDHRALALWGAFAASHPELQNECWQNFLEIQEPIDKRRAASRKRKRDSKKNIEASARSARRLPVRWPR